MSRIANDVRFGNGATGGTWYNPPYPRTLADVEANWPQYRQRAAWLQQRFPTGKIAIAGTGLAFTQYWLFADYGRQSWGCDIDWAITRAGGVLGAWANFVMNADVTNQTQMTSFRRMGNAGQNRYDVLFTEDLLPCANDIVEAQLMLTRLRAVGIQLVHLISFAGPENDTNDMLWLPKAQWRTICGPTDIIVDPNLSEVP